MSRLYSYEYDNFILKPYSWGVNTSDDLDNEQEKENIEPWRKILKTSSDIKCNTNSDIKYNTNLDIKCNNNSINKFKYMIFTPVPDFTLEDVIRYRIHNQLLFNIDEILIIMNQVLKALIILEDELICHRYITPKDIAIKLPGSDGKYFIESKHVFDDLSTYGVQFLINNFDLAIDFKWNGHINIDDISMDNQSAITNDYFSFKHQNFQTTASNLAQLDPISPDYPIAPELRNLDCKNYSKVMVWSLGQILLKMTSLNSSKKISISFNMDDLNRKELISLINIMCAKNLQDRPFTKEIQLKLKKIMKQASKFSICYDSKEVVTEKLKYFQELQDWINGKLLNKEMKRIMRFNEYDQTATVYLSFKEEHVKSILAHFAIFGRANVSNLIDFAYSKEGYENPCGRFEITVNKEQLSEIVRLPFVECLSQIGYVEFGFSKLG
jgi:serine/threonine protein kinase